MAPEDAFEEWVSEKRLKTLEAGLHCGFLFLQHMSEQERYKVGGNYSLCVVHT